MKGPFFSQGYLYTTDVQGRDASKNNSTGRPVVNLTLNTSTNMSRYESGYLLIDNNENVQTQVGVVDIIYNKQGNNSLDQNIAFDYNTTYM